MIPRIIHYCWFGRNPLPELAKKCIESWKIYLPDYKVKLWNEDNFNISQNLYVSEAYQAKKYAFVTDYVRLWALFNEGGIYMDTDVEVVKSLDRFLHLPAFSGFEDDHHVPTGIMASEISGVWVREQLDYYDNRHFLNADGSMDLTTNAQTISRIMAGNGFVLNNSYQVYKDSVHIFPKDYFCPLKYGKVFITENTHCIHHFAGTWNPPKTRFKKYFFREILGGNLTFLLVKLKRKLLGKSF